jgi:hypothetical protein
MGDLVLPGDVLVVAVLLAHHDVVGEVYLDGALCEVRLLAALLLALPADALGQLLGGPSL